MNNVVIYGRVKLIERSGSQGKKGSMAFPLECFRANPKMCFAIFAQKLLWGSAYNSREDVVLLQQGKYEDILNGDVDSSIYEGITMVGKDSGYYFEEESNGGFSSILAKVDKMYAKSIEGVDEGDNYEESKLNVFDRELNRLLNEFGDSANSYGLKPRHFKGTVNAPGGLEPIDNSEFGKDYVAKFTNTNRGFDASHFGDGDEDEEAEAGEILKVLHYNAFNDTENKEYKGMISIRAGESTEYEGRRPVWSIVWVDTESDLGGEDFTSVADAEMNAKRTIGAAFEKVIWY